MREAKQHDATPGAVQVSAESYVDSGQKDSLTIAEEDLSSHTPGQKLHSETNSGRIDLYDLVAQPVVWRRILDESRKFDVCRRAFCLT
jgi:hypothetical protein